MAPTIGAIAVVVDAPVIVLVGLVVPEVAPGTIRLILRRLPAHRLGITLVTLGAGEVAPVIQRLIDQTEMLVDVRQPGIGHVAGVALLVRNEVSVILAGRYIAVMAG